MSSMELSLEEVAVSKEDNQKKVPYSVAGLSFKKYSFFF